MNDMWASFTSGTYHFLQDLAKKNSQFDFYFMRHKQSTLVYYEHKRKKSIFVSGKTFSILHTAGSILPKGFVTMEHIPVTDDGGKLFQDRLAALFPELVERTGVTSMRALKQERKQEFVIMTQWKNERYEQLWKESPFHKEQDLRQFTRLSAYFAERPFTNEYFMIDEDDNTDELGTLE